MLTEFKCEAEYNNEDNISIVRCIGRPRIVGEITYWMNEVVLRALVGDGKHRVWCILDMSTMNYTPPSLVKHYFEITSEKSKQYVEETIIVANAALIRMAVQIFGKIAGIKPIVVKSVDMASTIIKERQKNKGKFPSLRGS